MSWLGSSKNWRLVSSDEEDAVNKMIPVANKRCTGIVLMHQRMDHSVSRIAEDCYLQGIRDAVESMCIKDVLINV